MKVIMRVDVDGVGMKGDVLEVADGYARNLLIPRGLALKASEGAERQAASMRRSRDLRDAADRSVAEEMATRLVNSPVTIAARAGEGGKLFGSVTTADVARAVEEQTSVILDRRALSSNDAVKELGTHVLTAKVHTDVEFPITVEVIAAE